MKKAVLLFFVFVLCLSAFYGCGKNIEENPVSDFEYTENENDGITITKYIGEDADVVIPSKINKKKVTEIGDYAFQSLNHLVSVTIPSSVTNIGEGAFVNCTELIHVNISSGVESIGAVAFSSCVKLTSITLPDSLKNLGNFAFFRCKSLKQINLPGSITNCGSGLFVNSGIETVSIGNGIDTISSSMFCGSELKEIVLPESITTIQNNAFESCSKLNSDSIFLDEGLVTVEYWAFAYNSHLTEITIPSTVQNIDEWAFLGCDDLEKLKFEGNAPKNFSVEDVNDLLDFNFIVYYHEGAEGFTSPEWNGYPTEIW